MNQYQIAGITNENGKKWLRQNEIDNLFRENPRLISDIINARIDEKNDELRASGFAEMLVRANSVKLIELVVDCPQKFWDESNNATRASYFRDSIQFFNNWIGANNLILSVQHGDEKSKRVHLHLFYLPITADLRLSAKDIIGKNYDMHNRQVQFYNEVSSKYGMPMPDFRSGRKHEDTNVFKIAKEEAQKIINNALDESKHILDFADEQAAEIVAKAKADAERLMQEAQAVYEKVKRERNAVQEEYAREKDRLDEIDGFFKNINSFGNIVNRIADGENIKQDELDEIFSSKKRFKDLQISRSRQYRNAEAESKASIDELRKLVEKRKSFNDVKQFNVGM